MANASATYPKTAACICGALTVTVTEAPRRVHACSCHDCQRRTGSAFTYTAFFTESAATISGEWRGFRRVAESGRWHETHFCPTCGCAVFMRLQAMPDVVAVSAGCFADADFVKPGRLYWTAHRHRWLATPDGVEPVETQ